MSRPCTAETPRCTSAHNLTLPLNPCCRGHVANVTTTVTLAAETAGVKIFMDYGTLLGAVRNPMLGQEPGIIAHDKDADVGFLGEDWEKLLAIAEPWEGPYADEHGRAEYHAHALGFHWRYRLPKQKLRRTHQHSFAAGDSVKVCLSETNHSNLDLFPWYDRPWRGEPDGNRYRYHYVHVDRFKGRTFPEERLLPLTRLMWEGVSMPAPADPEWFCEHRYGPLWRTPIHKNNDGVKR